MKPLEDYSIGQRIAITFIIVLVILFALAAVGFFGGRWEQAEGAPQSNLPPAGAIVPPSPFDDRLAALDREAIDNSYREKIEKLFSIWLADPTDQPRRAVNGAIAARKAYVGAMTEIEKREQQLRERKDQQR